MNFKFAVAAVLAASSMSAMAADQIVELNTNAPVTYFHAAEGTLFEGGSDLLTFTGLAAGTYNVKISLSGQSVTFDGKKTTLNGLYATKSSSFDEDFTFLGLKLNGATSPFMLDLVGTVDSLKDAGYSGQISFVNVSPVPEPTTYGMLLGGLGIMGFLARRKSKQA